MKKKTLVTTLLLAATSSLLAQTDRVATLQSARNLVITKDDGKSAYHTITTDQSLMLHKTGNVLILQNDSMPIGSIQSMRLVAPKKFALDEDSTTFNSYNVDHGLLALRCSFSLGKWNTFVAPFALSGRQVTEAFGNDTQLACYRGITEGDEAQVDLETIDLDTDETVVEANTYYIIRPTREPDIAEGKTTTINYGSSRIAGPAYIIPNVSMQKSNNIVNNKGLTSDKGNVRLRISGTYKLLTDKQKIYYGTARPFYPMNDDGLFYQATDSVEFKAFRNWLVWVKNDNNLPFRFYVDGIGEDLTMATGIQAPRQQAALPPTGRCYDLQGRQVDANASVRKGIYVINGKKMIKR
jgi:hypothetical protein